MGTIEHIVYQPIDQEYEEGQLDYIRIPVTSARLLANHGLENDRKAGHHPKRQLNILSREWLDKIAPLGYQTKPGEFGEQVTVANMDFDELVPGTRIQLGETAVVEITKGRTGCSRLEAAQGQSIAGIGPIGLLARVVVGGEIRVGDAVGVLDAQTTG